MLHLTIIAGAFIVMLLGSQQMVLVLFVALKVIVDLWAHRREHERVSATPLAVPTLGLGRDEAS